MDDTGGSSRPVGRQLVMCWYIPDPYAGQTTAMLHRVARHVERTGENVEILTLSALHDSEATTARLLAREALPDRVGLRNLYDDLRQWELKGTLYDRLATLPDAPPAVEVAAAVGSETRNRWGRRGFDETGEPVFTESYRHDGSLLSRDYPVDVSGRRHRYLQFFHPDGSSAKVCSTTWEVYNLWLDHLVGDEPTVILNESKTTARYLSRYANPLATKIHLFHESHLADPTDPFRSALAPAHARIMPHLSRFEAVVFLTRAQRQDVADRFGNTPNLHTVPNANPTPVQRPGPAFRPTRRGNRGVLLGSLNAGKRIDHAITAVAAVHEQGVPITFDIYGRDQGLSGYLRDVISRTRSSGYITLRGYRPDATKEFRAASFSVLSSRSEGQALVLLESMAGGCVPIAYDIRYGPREMIVDGESGFLVPPGDVTALAETVRRFLALPSREIRKLRANCRERVNDFGDEMVQQRWDLVRAAALARRGRTLIAAGVSIDPVEATVTGAGIVLRFAFAAAWDQSLWRVADAPEPVHAQLLLVGRNTKRPVRLPIRATDRGDQHDVAVTLARRDLAGVDRVSDVYLELSRETTVQQVRLRYAGPPWPGDRVEVFATSRGNLSLRVTGAVGPQEIR